MRGRRTLIINVLDRWNFNVRLDGPDPYRHLSRGVRRSPLIGQQGGRRLNTRLSLADDFEYLNLKNYTVAFICDQSCLRRSCRSFQCASYKKKFSFREQTRKKLWTFSPFLEGETALISADPVFPPITLLIYLCATVGVRHRLKLSLGVSFACSDREFF